MTQTNSTAQVPQIDAGQVNLALAESLREVATWLEMHAGDLPSMRASVFIGYGRSSDARAQLTALANALGDQAEERADASQVTIEGRIGGIRVWGSAETRELVSCPLPPPYEPILAVTPPVTPEEDAAWNERS